MNSPNPYYIAWNKLRRKLEKAAENLPDSNLTKVNILQTLFMMDTLEPDEEE